MALAVGAPSTTGRSTFYPLRVSRVDLLCDDAAAVTFEVPPELRAAYAFRPGQSLTLRRMIDGVEQRRSYSICSYPIHPEVGADLRVGVRVIPGGAFSSWLVRQVRPGDQIEVQTPSGSFHLDEGAGGRHVLVGAGSGITPLLSIAGSLLANPPAHVTLLYGNRTTASVMFAEELADLKDTFGSRFQLVHVLSREPREVALFSGRLDADRLRQILRALVPVSAVDGFWLCGPYPMVVAARELFAQLGVPSDRLHAELFFVEDAPPPTLRHEERAVDGPTSDVTVTLDGRSTRLVLPRDIPVLDSAQRSRSDLPFACKGGVCGTCRARVTSGEVRMRRNYALEPAEVEVGLVLTCQSFPITDELVLDFDS